MIRTFKFIAIAEGVSYLTLLFNMIAIKPSYYELYKTLLFPIGMAHGILFIGYVLIAIIIRNIQDWSYKDFFIVMIASFIPFATFYIEKKYVNQK